MARATVATWVLSFLASLPLLSGLIVVGSREGSLLATAVELQRPPSRRWKLPKALGRKTPLQLSCLLQRWLAPNLTDFLEATAKASPLAPNGTCAVVGSSGGLLSHRHGEAIDSADAVIRFNDAPLAGFEPLVGAKDDLRYINCQVANDFASGSRAPDARPSYLLNTDSLLRRDDALMSCPVRKEAVRSKYPGARIAFVAAGEVEQSFADFLSVPSLSAAAARGASAAPMVNPEGFDQNPNPTSGSMGMLLALAACREVKAYGMIDTSDDTPYHYYRTLEERSRDHRGDHKTYFPEKALWRKLATNSPEEIAETEVLSLPGFSTLSCPP